jgi:hypothetical protein
MSRARSALGFTVIEALVSLLLTLLFMTIAVGLLRDAHLASLAVRREAIDPTPQHIAQSLRTDVHRSRRIERQLGAIPGRWSYSPLSLVLPDGGIVRYDKSDETVGRELLSSAGVSLGVRPLLRDVLSWRWLELAPDLVEVELVFRRRPSNEAARRTWQDPGPTVETMRMRLALRAVPGRSGW